MKLKLGRTRWDLGWSSVLPHFKTRCRQLCLLVNVKLSVTAINRNGTAGYKRTSAVADKPWYITMMNGFINAFLNKRNIFWVTQSCCGPKYLPLSLGCCSKSYRRRQIQSHYLKLFSLRTSHVFFSENFIILELFKTLKCIWVAKLQLFENNFLAATSVLGFRFFFSLSTAYLFFSSIGKRKLKHLSHLEVKRIGKQGWTLHLSWNNRTKGD